jgi:adenylate cyclase
MTRKFVIALKKKRSGILIKYLEGSSISVTKGTSLLEASLQANIPHAHVCGGRGRCSTCRVQIIEGFEYLPEATPEELELLEKVNCGRSVRLACKTRPFGNCTVYPLLLPNVTLQQSLWKKNHYTGTDRNVAILFTDLRGFTSMAEDKLPYDVVYVLNQYFQFMGQAIETHHGRIDKFIGDAIMAVFGINRDQKQACRDALAAAQSMRFQLDRLNTQLQSELPEPLQMGFGIHCGHVIIGEMGYKDSHNFLAIGDATNTASRLESLTKDYDCELIVSQDVVDWGELDFSKYAMHQVELRGRQRPVQVYEIKDVKSLKL